MAITQTGTTIELAGETTNTGTFSSTIEVPADAELAIAFFCGHKADANHFSGGGMTLTKGGVDTAMTAIPNNAEGDNSTATYQGTMFYMVSPDTGTNKSWKWDWAGTGALDDANRKGLLTFWKGVDTASPIRDGGAGQASNVPFTSSELLAQTGDLVFAIAWGVATPGEGSIDSWSNLTLLEQITAGAGNMDAALATGSPSGNVTVAASTATDFESGGIIAAVIKPAGGGGGGGGGASQTQGGSSIMFLKQSTASQEVLLGPFLDDTDGSVETGLTIANTDIQLWRNGGTTLGNKNSGGATHISGGLYHTTLDASDTDTVGPLVIFVHMAGTLHVKQECDVLPANVYDSRYGADKLQVDIAEADGTAWNSGAFTATTMADNAVTAAKIATDVATELWSAATRTLTANTNLSISAADIRAALGLASANLDTQLTAIDDAVDTEVAAIKAKTDQLTFTTAGRVDSQVHGMQNDVITSGAVAASAAQELADQVWRETLADHTAVAGSTAASLNAAGSAGDPWTTALPGAYAAGTAGKIIGDNVDTTISSRAATGSIPTANQNADALLDRSAGVETGLTVRQWLRLAASVLFGKSSGHPTSPVYRDVNDTKDRITATVDGGNRTAVTKDPS